MNQPKRSGMNLWLGLVLIGLVTVLISVAFLFGVPKNRGVSMAIGEFLYEPLDLELRVGDELNLKVKNSYKDLYFGMMIEEYDFYEAVPPGEEKTLTLPLDKAGEFPIQYALGVTPELLYKFATGKLVVEHNYLYVGGATSTLVVAVGLPLYLMKKKGGSKRGEDVKASTRDFRFNLLRNGIISRIIKNRAFQFAVITPNLLIFLIIILTGLFGIRLHSLNFSTVFVWTIWLFALVAILVPFLSRVWCTICPLPAYGEWLQRKAFIGKKNSRPLTLARKWPARLRSLWLVNFTFVATALIVEAATFSPLITGYLMLVIVITAIVLSVAFERRAFCRYVCPISGFLGLYSMCSPLEVRVKDLKVCKDCHLEYKRRCWTYDGNEKGYGCPWFEYLPTMDRNNQCGLCMECIKTCPKDNIGLNIRPFGKDLVGSKRFLDEAFGSQILLAIAVFHVATTQGPWGWLKEWGGTLWTGEFSSYTAIFLGIVLLVIPGAFLAFSWFSRLLSGTKGTTLKTLFTNHSYSIIPLGLMVWISFISWIFLTYLSYAFAVISDPFGWGWDLFGTRGYPWTPFYPEALPYLQIVMVLIGLALTIYVGQRISRQLFRDEGEAWGSLVPMITFSSVITLLLIRFFV